MPQLHFYCIVILLPDKPTYISHFATFNQALTSLKLWLLATRNSSDLAYKYNFIIAEEFSKTIWVSKIFGLTANCNSAASCNGSLYFESGKPMHMYDWMDGAISIDLWTIDTCVVISHSGDMIGADCADTWFDICKLKERIRKYFNIKMLQTHQ